MKRSRRASVAPGRSRRPSWPRRPMARSRCPPRSRGTRSRRRCGSATRHGDQWEPAIAADRQRTRLRALRPVPRRSRLRCLPQPDPGRPGERRRRRNVGPAETNPGTRRTWLGLADHDRPGRRDDRLGRVAREGQERHRGRPLGQLRRGLGRCRRSTLTNAGTDKPILAVRGEDVYVAYNHTQTNWVSSSHDGGVTWESVKVQPTGKGKLGWSLASGGTVTPNGDVHFSWSGYEQNGVAKGPVNLFVSTSTDGGSTGETRSSTCPAHRPTARQTMCGWAYLGAQIVLDVRRGRHPLRVVERRPERHEAGSGADLVRPIDRRGRHVVHAPGGLDRRRRGAPTRSRRSPPVSSGDRADRLDGRPRARRIAMERLLPLQH